jgi:hypothetical protein
LALTNTTTTTVTTTNTQDGTKLVVSTNETKKTIGNYVTDVSIQPYIKNRVVSFYAYNMRPGRRLHVFFDSVNVDAYCAPGERIVSGNTAINNTYPVPSDTSNFASVTRSGDWGTAIYSDPQGRVAGQFNIPESVFKTGDRTFQLVDVDSIARGNDAVTTVSSATFTASNMNVTKENLTLTTVNPDLGFLPVSNTIVNVDTTVEVVVTPDNITTLPPPPPPPPIFFPEPVAQALSINTPNGETGIYATSIDVFFKQKALIAEHGITLYLCETINGYPNGRAVLPFSKVHKTYYEVNTSDDASVATRFTFESPVFLTNKQLYAFVLRPDNNDQDYQVWTAELGDTDVKTGYQVFSQPVMGTAFYGATEQQWTALQTEYVKFTLNRARFNSQRGQAVFYNTNTEFIPVTGLTYSNTSVSILSGDYVFESTTSSPTTANTSVRGVIDYYDDLNNIFHCENSTGNFTVNRMVQVHRFSNSTITPNTSTIIAYANTSSMYNPGINAIVPQFAYITPPGTSLEYYYRGTSNAYAVDTAEYKVTSGYDYEFYDRERIVASKTNELNNMSGNKSMMLKGVMISDSEFLSPAIDTVRYQQLVLKNDIDPIAFEYDEFFNNGVTKSKYISRVVTLAPGQDAEDLQVILTAFRPIGSDIEVWVKFLNGEDGEPINQKTWTPLYNLGQNNYSDPSNPSDFREYAFAVSSYYRPLQLEGTVTVSGTTVTGVNTKFLTELSPGWFVSFIPPATAGFREQQRRIVSIASNTSLTVASNFIGTYTTATTMYLAPPSTVAWSGKADTTALTGTVTTSTTNNSIIGSSTLFTTELAAGSIISIAGDQQTVVSISNSTFLTVGTPWSSAVSGANASVVVNPGLSYYNSSRSLFTSFRQFQIKIILRSNDSSKVPIIDDLRALAMQL